MRSYQQFNNYFVKNDSALERTYNTTDSHIIGSSTTDFNKTHIIDIPREYDNLAQINLKLSLTTDADNSNRSSYWACKIFKEIRLQCKRNKSVLQTIYPEYTLARIYSSSAEQKAQIEEAIDPVPAFNTLTPASTLYIPLFFWFSESPELFLRTRHLEQLELVLITNDDEASMGLVGNLTINSIEARMRFVEQREQPEFKGGRILASDIYREKIQTMAIGDITKEILLQNPYPSYLMILLVESTDASKDRVNVDNFKIKTRGSEWINIDRREDFKLYSSKKINKENTAPYVHQFTRDFKRVPPYADKDLIAFTEEMYPSYLTITTVNALGKTSNLSVLFEHLKMFDVTDNGLISETIMTGTFQFNKNSS